MRTGCCPSISVNYWVAQIRLHASGKGVLKADSFIHLPFRFHHVPEFQLNLWINRFEILVESIKEGYTSRNCHTFDIFIADTVNLFDERTNRIRVRNDQALVTCTHRRRDNSVDERHDPFGCIFERLRSGALQLLGR